MKKKTSFQKNIKIPTLKGAERKIRTLLRQLTRTAGFTNLSKTLLRDLQLVIFEAVTNAFTHGGCGQAKPARLRVMADPKKIEILIEDRGPGFSLAKVFRRPPEELAEGGRGLWIMKNLMDRVSYRSGRPNQLRLIRKLTRPKSLDAAMELFDRLHRMIQELKPLQTLYEEFIEFTVNLFNVERASLFIYQPEEGVLRVATSRGIPRRVVGRLSIKPGEGVAGYVFQSSRPLLVHNPEKVKRQGISPKQSRYATKSFLSIPVIASPHQFGEETMGVLNLTDKRDGTRFRDQEMKLLSLMAGQAASAFRIRHLIDQIKKHEGLNRELEIVREIQDRLIPEQFPVGRGVKIGGKCQLSPRGGGDYFDILELKKTLSGVIADVSGHYVGSAITMASFRSVYRSLALDGVSPGHLLRALRWATYEELVNLHQFISAWVFEFHRDGQLILSGAGHPPVLIYRAKPKTWEEVASHHLPLGLEDESRIQNAKVQLRKNDWVFLYTDGLFDPKMRGTGFDYNSFTQLVEKNLRKSPQVLVDLIFAEMSPHHRALRSPDDVALLALKKM